MAWKTKKTVWLAFPPFGRGVIIATRSKPDEVPDRREWDKAYKVKWDDGTESEWMAKNNLMSGPVKV